MGAHLQLGVIGQPIRHSLSPSLFDWLFSRLGIDARYGAKEVAPSQLASVVARLRGGEWAGLSVTLPHKEAVRGLIDWQDPLAQSAGAVNTLVRRSDGSVAGYNTDIVGCLTALERAGAPTEGARVLVLGAGGAARAALFGLLAAKAKRVRVANRSVERARALVGEAGSGEALGLEPEAMAAALEDTDVVVNATRVGMGAPDASPLPAGCSIPSGRTVLDMVYRPLDTRLLREARASGCQTVDGLWMLVYQALEQLRLWTGREVPDGIAGELHEHLKVEAT